MNTRGYLSYTLSQDNFIEGLGEDCTPRNITVGSAEWDISSLDFSYFYYGTSTESYVWNGNEIELRMLSYEYDEIRVKLLYCSEEYTSFRIGFRTYPPYLDVFGCEKLVDVVNA